MPQAKLTKRFIENIPLSPKGQKLYTDTDLPGFGLIVGTGKKTYFAQRQIKGRTVRVTIGMHGVFTPDQARTDAKELLVRMARGENPNETKRQQSMTQVTLRDACKAYQGSRKDLSAASLYKFERCKDKWFSDWMDKPLIELKRDTVAKRHTSLGKEYGASTANKALKTLRAIYNNAMFTNEALPSNPVKVLSLSKGWFEEGVRQSVIKPNQLKTWYEAVQTIENDAIRAYLCLLLFTGMRKNEGLKLRWENVDFNERTLTVPDTKNKKPLVIPMSEPVLALLKDRKSRTGKSAWVFPSSKTDGHIIEPKRWIAHVIERSKIKFMIHDLRRTFITIGESLDISQYTLKALVNHSQGGDVTAGYIIRSIDRLREPAQRIAEYIVQKVEATS